MSQKIIYDAETRAVTDKRVIGPTGFMSFNRLIETLKATGEFDGDEVVQVVLNERGIEFTFKGYEE